MHTLPIVSVPKAPRRFHRHLIHCLPNTADTLVDTTLSRSSLQGVIGSTKSSVKKRHPLRLNARLYVGLSIISVFILGSFILPFFNTVDPAGQVKGRSMAGTYKPPVGARQRHVYARGKRSRWRTTKV